jgi:hypothetical protein
VIVEVDFFTPGAGGLMGTGAGGLGVSFSAKSVHLSSSSMSTRNAFFSVLGELALGLVILPVLAMFFVEVMKFELRV